MTPDFQLSKGALNHSSTAEENGNGHSGPRASGTRRRKQRIIIHTSPFLRCIQTSIGVSGGIAEAQGTSEEHSHPNHRHAMHSAHSLHSGSPHIRAMEHWNSPQLSAISEPEEELGELPAENNASGNDRRAKPRLRVDAFLGEWLSPGYFKDITHPPDSRMMLATAKANLLDEKNYEAVTQNVAKASPSTGNFPGGWGSGKETPSDDDDGPLARLPKLNQSLPRLNRSGSHSSAGSLAHRGSNAKHGHDVELASDHAEDGYSLPIPSYAISSGAPIPPGYVAYAKNACVDVDYQWDSMRSPHEWGDGGEYDEEWSSMHRRFRRGLQDMISWYRNPRNNKDAATGAEDDLLEEDDPNTDTVLILVTHSAGCNALIGALTNQPVLLDPGTASLTMAVRKPEIKEESESLDPPPSPNSHRRRSSIDLGVSEDYDVKILASTDHLRTASTSSSRRSSRTSSPGAPGQRIRATSLASTPSQSVIAEGEFEADGTSKRSATAATPRSNGLWSKPISSSPTGLWSKPVDKAPLHKPVHENSPLRESTTINKIAPCGTPERVKEQPAADMPRLASMCEGPSAQGLWGSPPPTSSSAREKGPKRRWTLHEQRHV